MSPEYGATVGFFPVDDETLNYLRFTGRAPEQVALVEAYCKEQGLFRTDDGPEPMYSEVVELDLRDIVPSIAGPARPQDRIALTDSKKTWHMSLPSLLGPSHGIDEQRLDAWVNESTAVKEGAAVLTGDPERDPFKSVEVGDGSYQLGHGAVVIAAITSCTNTSNPQVLMAAGLVAKKAVERGLKTRPWVKTSLAPGSQVVTKYLTEAGLLPYLEQLGFFVVGYGCTTCIGNSGPLHPAIEEAVIKNDVIAASVLSGNRNFEARVHQNIKANFLMSPPLVVAFALAGRVDIDMTTEPLGKAKDGSEVFLKDLWPSLKEIRDQMAAALKPEVFRKLYKDFAEQNPKWNEIPSSTGVVYDWDKDSTYIQEPPFFEDFELKASAPKEIRGAVALGVFGDSVTTDHISPAGAIKKSSPAGRFLLDSGVAFEDFNSYGSRRGNDRIMTRGTFANVRIKNLMLGGEEGGDTLLQPEGKRMSIYDAAVSYRERGQPLVIFAGQEYGTGSSRDWAAKGTRLLGVSAVIAQSYERIHRSNLVGMGVLPLQFKDGASAQSLGIDGTEKFDVLGLDSSLKPQQDLTLRITKKDGSTSEVPVRCRIDTPIEIEYYQHGGILPYVLREILKKSA
jgi:aconitate hydratase